MEANTIHNENYAGHQPTDKLDTSNPPRGELYNQKKQVQAMKELLDYYEKKLIGDVDALDGCPLCAVYSYGICIGCVWVIEKGDECKWDKDDDEKLKEYDITQLRDGDSCVPSYIHKAWCERRIGELKEWIKKYDK